MTSAITFVLSNFTLSFLILGIIVSIVVLAFRKPPRSPSMTVEAFASYFYLFSIGFSYLYNFIMHVFFGKMAASFIGWADSPFQLEVGFASLGFALLGFIAFKGNFSYRVAAVVSSGCFLWGAAGGHVYQMISQGNFAPGNAGIIFYTDIGLPLAGLALLWLECRFGRPSTESR